jgi:Ser/Thr protein kinase RdoA (MazF antagonist)
LQRILAATGANAATVGVLKHTGVPLLLQSCGADAKLKRLAEIASGPGATLLVHRPERRAVVGIAERDCPCFVKITRAKKTPPLVAAWERARAAAGAHFDTPELGESFPEQGMTLWSVLPGEPLHEALSRPGLAAKARAVGAALAHLHAADPSAVPPHTCADEAAVLRRWHEHLRPFAPQFAELLSLAIEATTAALLSLHQTRTALIHRDFHDKQVFVTKSARVGMLDFDMLAAGEPELDIANFLAHLELRAAQNVLTAGASAEAAESFLAGYDSRVNSDRLRAYTDSARVRLACVYSFRPRWSTIPEAMRALIGSRLLIDI